MCRKIGRYYKNRYILLFLFYLESIFIRWKNKKIKIMYNDIDIENSK